MHFTSNFYLSECDSERTMPSCHKLEIGNFPASIYALVAAGLAAIRAQGDLSLFGISSAPEAPHKFITWNNENRCGPFLGIHWLQYLRLWPALPCHQTSICRSGIMAFVMRTFINLKYVAHVSPVRGLWFLTNQDCPIQLLRDVGPNENCMSGHNKINLLDYS